MSNRIDLFGEQIRRQQRQIKGLYDVAKNHSNALEALEAAQNEVEYHQESVEKVVVWLGTKLKEQELLPKKKK